jgi:preprotein translocase subunit SecE
VRETQSEMKKVTWPTRRETLMTTFMIIVMALIAGVFFLLIDSGLGYAVSRFLGMQS